GEPLVLDEPLSPLLIHIKRRNRPGIVRYRTGRVGDVLVEGRSTRFRLGLQTGRSLERQPAPFTEEESASRDTRWRPVVVGLPRVRPGAETDDLGKAARIRDSGFFPRRLTTELLVEVHRPILEVVREEGDLDLLAELPGRG